MERIVLDRDSIRTGSNLDVPPGSLMGENTVGDAHAVGKRIDSVIVVVHRARIRSQTTHMVEAAPVNNDVRRSRAKKNAYNAVPGSSEAIADVCKDTGRNQDVAIPIV